MHSREYSLSQFGIKETMNSGKRHWNKAWKRSHDNVSAQVKHMLQLSLKYSSAALEMEPTNVKAVRKHVRRARIMINDRARRSLLAMLHKCWHCIGTLRGRPTSAGAVLSRRWSDSGGLV